MKAKLPIFEKGSYWIRKAKNGYEVYKNGVSYSARCSIIGYEGEKGLKRAIEEIDRRIAAA